MTRRVFATRFCNQKTPAVRDRYDTVFRVPYTATELQAKITALEAAFERHERSVQFADRVVTYRSFEEIRDQIAYFQTQLNALQSRPKQAFGVTSKGFGL